MNDHSGMLSIRPALSGFERLALRRLMDDISPDTVSQVVSPGHTSQDIVWSRKDAGEHDADAVRRFASDLAGAWYRVSGLLVISSPEGDHVVDFGDALASS